MHLLQPGGKFPPVHRNLREEETMDRQIFIFYRDCVGLASRFRGCGRVAATVPHRCPSLARKERGVRRQSTLCRGGPSFASVSPLKPSERIDRDLPCVCPSRGIIGHCPSRRAGAFLIRAGATRNTVPPAFPSGIGFDPCIASMQPSGGREERLTAATPTDDSSHKPFVLTLSSHYTTPMKTLP